MTKAERQPDLKEFATDPPASGEASDNLTKLSDSAAKANAGLDRKDNKLADSYASNWKTIKDARVAIKAIEKELKSAKGFLSSCYAQAKGDGCKVDLLKLLAKQEDLVEKHGPDVIDQEMKDIAWLAGLVNSRVVEMTSFKSLLEETDKVNHYTQGYRAGLAGDGADGNPYKPGSDNHGKWEKGRRDGQVALAKKLFGKKNKAAGKTASERRGKQKAATKKKR